MVTHLYLLAAHLLLPLSPFVPFTREMFTQSLGDLADATIHNPLPLKSRLVIGLCWVLFIGGIIVKNLLGLADSSN